MLFADGHSNEKVGLVLGLLTETVRAYLRAARLGYRKRGSRASNRLQLRARPIEDGELDESGW